MTQLKRQVGVSGAVILGLGSIVGTGAYVGVGLAYQMSGVWVMLAVWVGAGLALCNGLSSAQLAAAHPVAGGTYVYGRKYLTPGLGFAAGWLFLVAKSASAAAAAMTLGHLLADLLGLKQQWMNLCLSAAAIGLATLLSIAGVKRSNWANAILLLVGLFGLLVFVVWAINAGGGTGEIVAANHNVSLIPTHGADAGGESSGSGGGGGSGGGWREVAIACGLMFVAYTGYGRIATMGEEVMNPRRTIVRAMVVALVVAALFYAAVAWATGFLVGAEQASVEMVADQQLARGLGVLDLLNQTGGKRTAPTWVVVFVGLGAVAAMGGVLLNLVLGLSRVVLAMGRHGDLPESLAKVNQSGTSPTRATIVVGVLVCLMLVSGSVATAWSFSALTVLLYYGLTNASVLRLAPSDRFLPVWISWLGLLGCLSLAAVVEGGVWWTGLGVLLVGLIWRLAFRAWASRRDAA